MARTIKLKFPSTCRECGAHLPVGAAARYYGPRKVYGTTCHGDTRPLPSEGPVRDGKAAAAGEFVDIYSYATEEMPSYDD